MSIRRAAGEWQPLMLGVEREACGVCHQGLSRATTLVKGGWERCSVCGKFVHYTCLASGRIKFLLRRRPRVCRTCEHVP